MNLISLDKKIFQTDLLIKEYPPKWGHPNKQAVFDLICSANCEFKGQVEYTRWLAAQIPGSVEALAMPRIQAERFTYPLSSNDTDVDWHMNFADRHLFIAYDSSLLAQDELQVLEHPVLGSLREALDDMGYCPETVNEEGSPTPVTISGVQRCCAVDTRHGLYGNAFAVAAKEDVLNATRLINPPSISNILAMAAPEYGMGDYGMNDMAYVLTAAYTGYTAARQESHHLKASSPNTIIHTGFWGCGAFGGNRTIMTILQTLAADLAGVGLVFYAFNPEGVSLVKDALKKYQRIREIKSSVDDILDALIAERFQWGVSDGN
ncbi:poly(ADP-ribose) glycohydrolase [Desulfosudis oleivorans]|uniref:PARG catalytic Macro domain-containing protein n=1 Tax=Desulfosudis oleivorans (strain DSM 6200 / JCM 39069 / Hxd3) TaxID=96561 RepID=A8ZXE3_DESOH|nr:hypothetical protein [Desulfosudis oleivorans]ABW68522.1 hypothetical protein Dole_2719 [Desulfosudis oleivorans Hxd3]